MPESIAKNITSPEMPLWEQQAVTIISQLGVCFGIEEMLKCAAEQMRQVLRADRALVIEFQDQTVLPIQIEALSDPALQSFRGAMPPWEQCPYLKAVAGQELVIRNDVSSDAIEPDWLDIFKAVDVHGFIATPVVVDSEIAAVLVFHTCAPRQWLEADIAFIKIMTDQIAIRMYQDIADQYRRRIESDAERYRLILEASNDAIFDWDVVQDTSFANHRFYDLVGLPEGTHIGLTGFMSRIHPDDRESVTDALKRLFQEDVPFEMEYRFDSAAGYRWLFARGRMCRDRQGQPARMVGVLTDITHLK